MDPIAIASLVIVLLVIMIAIILAIGWSMVKQGMLDIITNFSYKLGPSVEYQGMICCLYGKLLASNFFNLHPNRLRYMFNSICT